MAKRAGKAASRRARQRTVRRPAVPSSPVAPAPTPDVEADVAVVPAMAAPTSRAGGLVPRRAVGSQLTATERSEYHYVERDLRDIAILIAVMAALLFVAWLVFSASGLG